MRLIIVTGLVGIFVAGFMFNGWAEDLGETKTNLAPGRGVVLETHRKWRSTRWGGGGESLLAKNISLSIESGFPRFTIGQPKLRRVWTYHLNLPIDFNRYPIVVLKYRSWNTHTSHSHYVIWLDDGTGPNFGGMTVFRSRDLIPDGEIHELCKDLREFNPKGPIKTIALSVMCGDTAPAIFDLVGIHFETPPDTSLEELLKEDVSLNVLVVNPQGEPVEGVKVVVDAERKNFARSAFTDAEGFCRVTPLMNETGKHMLRVEIEGMVPVEHSKPKQIGKKPVRITVRKGTHCGGIVEDEKGNPIKGATVSLVVSSKRMENVRIDNRFVDVMTDGKGCWETPLLPADADRISVKLAHPDFVSDTYHKRSLDMKRFREGKPIVFAMQKGLKLCGRIVDENHNPISGANMLIGAESCGYDNIAAKTDKAGYFEFKSLPPGETIITAQHGKYAAKIEKVRLSEEKEITIVLKKGKSLFGKIVNEKGEPIHKARITSDTWKGYRTLSLSQRTNEQGEFRFNSAPEGTIEFDIMARGYADKRNFPLVARDEPYEIVLSEPLKVSGKVIDAKTGKPIPRFELLVGSIFRKGERAYWGRRAKKFENQEGHFEITESYPREAYKLRALAEGYAFTEYPEIFKVGQDVRDIVIGLKKGFPIKGKVYSVKKEPLGNVKVILGGQDAHIQVDGIRVAHSRGFSKEAHTDGKGNFAFDGLGEETYQLLLLHSEQGGKILPGIIPSKETKEVQLELYAKLEGLAYENDKPLADCEISLHPCSPFPRFGRQAFHFYSRTKTDQNSHWGFEKILPGVYAASIMTRIPHGTGYCTHSKSRQGVVLAPGERKFIVLGGIGGPTLKGKVTDTTGEPVVGAAVRLSPSFTCGFSSFYDANTQADGTYEITEIQPGKYRAYFSLYEREGARCCGFGKPAMEARRKILIKPDYPEVKLDITLEKIFQLSVGDSAPDFSAETLKGEKICLNDLKGKTVLLDFWSTWCGPCVAEISNVKKAYQKYKDDIVFLGINVDTSKETVAKFIEEEKIEWPQIFDGKGWESEIVKKYGIRGIPAVFLIDQDGKIAAKDLRGESLMQTIESVIKK